MDGSCNVATAPPPSRRGPVGEPGVPLRLSRGFTRDLTGGPGQAFGASGSRSRPAVLANGLTPGTGPRGFGARLDDQPCGDDGCRPSFALMVNLESPR